MTLNLNDLIAGGAFISAAQPQVEREVTWHNLNGEEKKVTVWVRLASYQTYTSMWKDQGTKNEYLAARISSMICDEAGAPVLTAGDILGTADPARGPMCETLFLALLGIINDVNEGKVNPPTNSGSN